MKKLAALVVAILILGLVAFSRGSQVQVTCGPTVTDPATMIGIRTAQTLGDRVAALQHHQDPVTIFRAVKGMYDTVALWIDTFTRRAKGLPDSKLVKWWGSDIAQQRAQAVADCAAKGNGSDPSTNPDCGLGAAAAVTGRQLVITVASRYFPADQVPIAVAIAGAESSYRPDALLNYRGARMLGLWQINDHAHPELLPGRDWKDPLDNAWMAYRVWSKAGKSWTPWSTYNSGAYKRYLAPDSNGSISSAPMQCAPVDTVRNFTGNKPVNEAVGWMSEMAADKTPISVGMCLHWVGVAYGHQTTQAYTAIGQWQIIPDQYKHQGVPPRGALVFWNTDRPGQARPGHIALSLGGGRVLSTDYPRAGIIGVADIKTIDTWGRRVGWTDPWFPGQTS